MYVKSLTYEPFHGGAFEAVLMFHVELVHKGQLYFEPSDFYKLLQKKAAQIGNTSNYVYFQVPDQISGPQLEEILQLFGTLKDNGIGIVAESSAYYRPAWLHLVDYMIAACGDEQPLPYAANELRYYPEGSDLQVVKGHPNAIHYLALRRKWNSNSVFEYLAKTGYRLLTPKLFRYRIILLEEEGESNENDSTEDRAVHDNSGAVFFGRDSLNIPEENEDSY